MILSNKTISPKGPTTSFSKASQDLTQQMELPDCQRIAGFNYFFLFPEHFKDFTFVFLIHNCRWILDLGNSRSGAFYRWDMDLFSHLSKLKKETINLIIYHSLFSVLSLLFHFTFYTLLFVLHVVVDSCHSDLANAVLLCSGSGGGKYRLWLV